MGRTAKGRADREVAKSIALQLPDVELASHHGTLDVRVRNKIFATFPSGSKGLVVKVTPENLQLMTAQRPEAYSKVWGETWVQVALEEVDRATLQALLIETWKLAAPTALRKLYDDARLEGMVR